MITTACVVAFDGYNSVWSSFRWLRQRVEQFAMVMTGYGADFDGYDSMWSNFRWPGQHVKQLSMVTTARGDMSVEGEASVPLSDASCPAKAI